MAGITPLTTESLTLGMVRGVHALLGDLVQDGAALGWVVPPTPDEVADLLNALVAASELDVAEPEASSACVVDGSNVVGFGCWQRYGRPTHRPHADLTYLAVARAHQRQGVGAELLDYLIDRARVTHVEQLTLDSRGDNVGAHALWRSRGFVEYGRLVDFVAVGENRYDKSFWVLDLRE
jgi:ribosomal protein S18 acetylase RimI-like enzyme